MPTAEIIGNRNLLDFIKILALSAMPIIAFLALKNWKRQDRANREAAFLDELIETTHTYIAELSTPIFLMRIAKVGIKSHVPTWEHGDEADKAIKGAIDYIQKRGQSDASRLQEALDAVRPATIRLRSLAAKGQIFKFNGYPRCSNAVTEMARHFDSIEAFKSVIGSPDWNWENPDVVRMLRQQMIINIDGMEKSITRSNTEIIKFSTDTYKRLYA